MNKRLLFLGAAAALSIGIVGTAFYAANKNLVSLKAEYINPDPVVVETVTVTSLTYTNFTLTRNFWAESPNGNLIGLYGGGSLSVDNGKLHLMEDESWINTNGVVPNEAERKYAFNEIMSITVSFTGSLSVKTPSKDEPLSNNEEMNLDNASRFEIYPTSSHAYVSKIIVKYNSTADHCY